MRLYRIDSLSSHDMEKIRHRLAEMDLASTLPDIYWLPIPATFLTETQAEHAPTCGPYVMGLEIEPDALNLEFLVRSKTTLHCACLGYASLPLVSHMIAYVDAMLHDLGIRS